MSSKNRSLKGGTARQTSEEKAAASERHDAAFFKTRRATEAANIAKTLRLREQRRALELKRAQEAEAAGVPLKKTKAKAKPKASA